MIRNGKKLVHYTSAAAAISIIRYGRVWMRNLRCMNDFMEVDHGIQLMQRSITPPVDTQAEHGLRALMSALNATFPGLADDGVKLFDNWNFGLRNKTYVTCLSERESNEETFGRLSMWRSYTANQVGVALVINPMPLYSLSQTFGAFSSPVHYFGDSEVGATFEEIAKSVLDNKDLLATKDRQDVLGHFFNLLRATAMCTKHPGFVEEREWRIMHTEKLDDRGILELDVETIAGIPQQVYKIPLQDTEAGGLTGITIPDLLEAVIIGPTQFPIVVWDALALELERAGVKDAVNKVSYSGIPLRT
ncbi:DUF2971 domain-containing protein [Rhizobium sp. BK060]|uniref:DUF2971 domain-containing protein n=1 Tax=Rhizobium sp. BK060 TaxID=2587096 RepID=UPI00161F3228|nr:DUF2971 domain-containing protein [Rhizobium sp. BK060]MBB3398829.1 hypothetical protein [Rhizobium sp. BK060]